MEAIETRTKTPEIGTEMVMIDVSCRLHTGRISVRDHLDRIVGVSVGIIVILSADVGTPAHSGRHRFLGRGS